MLAKNVASTQNPPNNPPNASSFTDTPLVNEVKHCEKSEDEEMLPLIDITDDVTGWNEDTRKELINIFAEVVCTYNFLCILRHWYT